MDKKGDKISVLSIHIDSEWKEKLIDIAQQKNISLEKLIASIIGNYLGESLEHEKLEKLTQDYEKLNQRLSVLEAKNLELEKIEAKFHILEKLVENLQYQINPRHIDKGNITHSLDDEDIYDEPDEILTDFLD
ncbi:hypothetical protein [Cyanobacterium aponinum]|uniref:hypothetical protein n=1 Tax=Cyanobacterium aponinum TaxID=379064 RepID=UPI000C12A512|nr:hypothetical protein [Cyanobacterium aponinum]PHV61697.1 hypothetical protein CSQ80_14380 [Cyanobacterium aponinum IPPAS B-1201]